MNAPRPVLATLKRLQASHEGYLQLKSLGGRFYVHEATSVWDKAAGKPRKVTAHFGSISAEGVFRAKRVRRTRRGPAPEVFEHGAGQLAYTLLADVRQQLGRFTDHVDELVAMAVLRAIDPQPLRLQASRWERLDLSRTLQVSLQPDHLSRVLQETGTGKAWWHEFFRAMCSEKDFLLYDLTSIFSWSQNIKRAERGYNADHQFLNQLGVAMAFSTSNGLPCGVEVFWGSMKDSKTFHDFLDVFPAEGTGFVVDRGMVDKKLIDQFRARGIRYVMPLRKNNRLMDLKQVRWEKPFMHHGRPIRWARQATDLGNLYLFEDPKLRGEQEQALLRRVVEEELTSHDFDEKRIQAGIIPILNNLDMKGPELFDLFKSRAQIEQAFDAMKNHLDADKTHMQNDEALRGFFFITLLAMRVYFAVLKRLKEHKLSHKISVAEVFLELAKVQRYILPAGKPQFAQIPSRAKRILDLFPEAQPTG